MVCSHLYCKVNVDTKQCGKKVHFLLKWEKKYQNIREKSHKKIPTKPKNLSREINNTKKSFRGKGTTQLAVSACQLTRVMNIIIG